MGATIYDVSKLSGVSIATVSRAFSEPERVRELTRKRVYEAAEALHYYPNAIARAMAKQRTDRIGYLICKRGATILDEFYAGIAEGIMRKANEHDYQLMISTVEDWRQTANTAQSKQLEGVILAGNAPADIVTDLKNQGIALVMVNNRMAGFDFPCILADESGGVRQAVDYFIKRGHRHIGMVAGRFSPYIIGERYNAFINVMQDRGLLVKSADMKLCERDIRSATEAALELLDRPERPTAVLAANDVLGAGVLKAARQLKIRVPEDLAVIGIDDSVICKMLEPELTSVHIDCGQMGELAVDRLHDLLEGRREVPTLTVVPEVLKVRRSV